MAWPLRIYSLGTSVLKPLAPALIKFRRRRGKEDLQRWTERRGEPGQPRPDGPLCWLHAASVGEAMTVLPLTARLVERGVPVLMTTGTVTSATLATQRLPRGAIHQYVPLDVPSFVRRFLDHWRPSMAIFVESELWPALLNEADKRDIPLFLVNGRMSPRSFRRWRRFRSVASAVLGLFEACFAQSKADAERLSALGARSVVATGNLKFDVPPLPVNQNDLAALRTAVGKRRVWLAASTHAGEEEAVARAHIMLRERFPDLLTIIAPRHPERGEAIGTALAAAGLTFTRRSQGDLPMPQTGIYVADTLGELGTLYSAVPIVFVGGSLVPVGGHNPIEPAKLNVAVIHGTHVHNFAEAYEALDESGASRVVVDVSQLAYAVEQLTDDPSAAALMASNGAETVSSLAGALDRTMAALEPTLVRLLQ